MRNWSQHEAFDFLETLVDDETGIGILHGHAGSGKSAVINQFLDTLPENEAVADIDGTRIKAEELLTEMLDQFGYQAELNSVDELLNMIRVFSVQQTRARRAPFVIVRNFNAMYPSALNALCKLAAQRASDKYALRMLLVAESYFERIVRAPSMRPITRRLSGSVGMRPAEEIPRILVSHGGKLVQDVPMYESRALIGRSAFSDILLEENGVSRQHAFLIQDEDSLVVIDLRSRNGTFVNSQPVASKVLAHSDIISVGNFRLKVDYPAARRDAPATALETSDTAKMKTIADARQERLVRVSSSRERDTGSA